MSDIFDEYTKQLRDSLDSKSSLGRLSVWIEKHTKHNGSNFSFKEHEYQRDIVDSTHNNVVVIKPSQVGLTECSIRLILSFLSVEAGTVALHLLPTLGEAQKAVKSRFDPIIRGSSYLRSVVHSGSDSSSFKQIADSQLFTGGTFGKAVISIPTDLLSVDEYDFTNTENVSTAESRLTHSRFVDPETGVRGIRRFWSTPTATGAGVDGLYAQSNQKKRLVKCKHCGKWMWPQFLKHTVVSGWDKDILEMDHVDAINLANRGLLATARLLCETCHEVITKDNLGPDYREWVATYPNLTYREGYHVSPFDLPSYHSAESIMRKMIDYRNNYNHFTNFVLGLAYSDASNSILDEMVETYTTIRPVTPDEAESSRISGCVAGLDVGRTSWLIIAKPNYAMKILDIIWVESIRLEGSAEDDLKVKVLQRLRQYGVIKSVMDSMPYTPSILAIQASMPVGWVLPNFYTLRDTKLPIYVVNEKDNVIASHRTKALNLMAKKVNSGQIRWPMLEEMATVRKHLQGIKRIDRSLDDGTETSDWVKVGEDHYAHAAGYLSLAAELVEVAHSGWAPMPTIHEVVVGSQSMEEIDRVQ